MGKAIVGILLIAAMLAAVVFFAAQPSMPTVAGARIDRQAAKRCLRDIEQRYSSEYLTYAGHVKAWSAHWADKLGIGLSADQQRFFTRYTLFEGAVSCYISLSGDPSLNMTLSPSQFHGTLKAISESYEVSR
jgi:hypothetical protein